MVSPLYNPIDRTYPDEEPPHDTLPSAVLIEAVCIPEILPSPQLVKAAVKILEMAGLHAVIPTDRIVKVCAQQIYNPDLPYAQDEGYRQSIRRSALAALAKEIMESHAVKWSETDLPAREFDGWKTRAMRAQVSLILPKENAA